MKAETKNLCLKLAGVCLGTKTKYWNEVLNLVEEKKTQHALGKIESYVLEIYMYLCVDYFWSALVSSRAEIWCQEYFPCKFGTSSRTGKKFLLPSYPSLLALSFLLQSPVHHNPNSQNKWVRQEVVCKRTCFIHTFCIQPSQHSNNNSQENCSLKISGGLFTGLFWSSLRGLDQK